MTSTATLVGVLGALPSVASFCGLPDTYEGIVSSYPWVPCVSGGLLVFGVLAMVHLAIQAWLRKVDLRAFNQKEQRTARAVELKILEMETDRKSEIARIHSEYTERERSARNLAAKVLSNTVHVTCVWSASRSVLRLIGNGCTSTVRIRVVNASVLDIRISRVRCRWFVTSLDLRGERTYSVTLLDGVDADHELREPVVIRNGATDVLEVPLSAFDHGGFEVGSIVQVKGDGELSVVTGDTRAVVPFGVVSVAIVVQG